MMFRFTKLFCTLLPSMLSLGLATPLFAGPVPSPTATPTATPTPTSDVTPTPGCPDLWLVDTIITLARGQNVANNSKVKHIITGNIVDPTSLGQTAHRIPICAETKVDITVTDATGNPTLTPTTGGIECSGSTCVVQTLDAKEKYTARSEDGKDTDRLQLLPQ